MFVPLLKNSIVTFSGPWNIDEAQDHFVASKDWMDLPGGCEEARSNFTITCKVDKGDAMPSRTDFWKGSVIS